MERLGVPTWLVQLKQITDHPRLFDSWMGACAMGFAKQRGIYGLRLA